MMSIAKLARLLRLDQRAAAMTEFALAMPLVLTAGLWGLETANFALMNMRVNQVAMQIADNASRIGDTSTLSNQKIYENDINDLLRGSDIQAGNAIDLYEYGRVFVSSLQVEPGSLTNQQYIAWQRCKGKKRVDSSYGVQDTGKGDPTFQGMGPAGEEVAAQAGDAVMFVEIQYDYGPIVTDAFISDRTIRSRAAFQVRGSRDLSEIYQRDPADPDEVARCDIFDSYKEGAPPPRETGGWNWIFSDNPNASGGGSGSGSSSSSSGGSSGSGNNGSSGSNNGSSGSNNGSSGSNNGSSGSNNGSSGAANGSGDAVSDVAETAEEAARRAHEEANNCTYGPLNLICWPNGGGGGGSEDDDND